jgi:hypothetical protein
VDPGGVKARGLARAQSAGYVGPVVGDGQHERQVSDVPRSGHGVHCGAGGCRQRRYLRNLLAVYRQRGTQNRYNRRSEAVRDTGIEPVDATGNASRAASTTGTEASLEFGVEIGGTTGDWRKLRGPSTA